MNNLINENHNSFGFTILSGRSPIFDNSVDEQNECFDFYCRFWENVFKKNKCDSVPDPNVFYRQEKIVALQKNGRTIGTLFFSTNNLASNATKKISYFARPYIDTYIARCLDDGVQRIATYEMLAVDPQFRRTDSGVSCAKLLLMAIIELLKDSGSQCLIGPVRTDNHAKDLVLDLGWELVSDPYMMHGTPVALSLRRLESSIRNTEKKEELEFQRLWGIRNDLTQRLVERFKAA
jgi:hypothetical protein